MWEKERGGERETEGLGEGEKRPRGRRRDFVVALLHSVIWVSFENNNFFFLVWVVFDLGNFKTLLLFIIFEKERKKKSSGWGSVQLIDFWLLKE